MGGDAPSKRCGPGGEALRVGVVAASAGVKVPQTER